MTWPTCASRRRCRRPAALPGAGAARASPGRRGAHPERCDRREVRAEYGLGDEVVATPLGVDASWFDAAPAEQGWLTAHRLPERYLLFVGTVEPRKACPGLLRALRLLHDAEPDTPPLVLVGPPGWGPALQTAALPAGAVLAAGYLDTADLRRLVAGAAVLVYPTLYEGLRAATTGGLRRGHTRGRQRPAGGPRGHRRAGHAGPGGRRRGPRRGGGAGARRPGPGCPGDPAGPTVDVQLAVVRSADVRGIPTGRWTVGFSAGRRPSAALPRGEAGAVHTA